MQAEHASSGRSVVQIAQTMPEEADVTVRDGGTRELDLSVEARALRQLENVSLHGYYCRV